MLKNGLWSGYCMLGGGVSMVSLISNLSPRQNVKFILVWFSLLIRKINNNNDNSVSSQRYSDGRRETLIGKKGSTSLSNTPRSFESDRRRLVDKNLAATPVGSGFNTPRDSILATPRGSETPRVSNLATPRGAGLGTPSGSNFERWQGSDTPRGSNVANETITPRALNDLATPRGSATITRRQNSSRENRSVCVSK